MMDSSTRSTGSTDFSNATLSTRIRRMLEPLIMSLVTTIVIFHIYFGGDSSTSTTHHSLEQSGALDAPYVGSSTAVTDPRQILVKRRYPDPPAMDFHSKFPSGTSADVIPIFYHVYIPHTAERKTNALRIIKEQLDDFSAKTKNNKASPLITSTPATIFYQTIGEKMEGNNNNVQQQMNNNNKNDVKLDSDVIDQLCQERGLFCHFLGHDDDGREELTLHHLHKFCLADKAQGGDKRRVVYLHNKGSHHYSTLNERWRRKMMQAITHEKCLKPPMETCTLCGLFVTAERGIFVAGNFWVAQCAYIRQLLPPLTYEGQMERVVKDALYLRLEQKMTMNMHRHWPPSFGTGRYAAEYWAGSHPTIIPCDFSHSFHPEITNADNTLDFLSWVNASSTAEKPASTLKWTLAPKHPIKIANKNIRTSERQRLPEYFLLAGNIFRWYEFYDDVPGEFSWVWAWFPDGRKWRNAVRLHGRDALTELTKQVLSSNEHD